MSEIKLNLGCGRDVRDGWVNIDSQRAEGVLHTDLDCDYWHRWGDFEKNPLAPNSVDHSIAFHLIEHLELPLDFMEGLWHVTKPGGTVELRTPYGSSDDAWEDPTHVRPYFVGSWGYFGQPHYWRADYGYEGDWKVRSLELITKAAQSALDAMDAPAQHSLVFWQRNTIEEMRVVMEAVKPARPPKRELQEPLNIVLRGQ